METIGCPETVVAKVSDTPRRDGGLKSREESIHWRRRKKGNFWNLPVYWQLLFSDASCRSWDNVDVIPTSLVIYVQVYIFKLRYSWYQILTTFAILSYFHVPWILKMYFLNTHSYITLDPLWPFTWALPSRFPQHNCVCIAFLLATSMQHLRSIALPWFQ